MIQSFHAFVKPIALSRNTRINKTMGEHVQQEEWHKQGRRVGKMALIKFQLFAGQMTKAACQADVLLQWRREGWLASPATEGHRSCRPEPATDAPGAVPRCLPAPSCRTPSTRLQSLLHYSGGGRKRNRERGRERERERASERHPTPSLLHFSLKRS